MDENEIYGARQEDWNHLVGIGLTEDLLPVVSNPGAHIMEGSSLSELGKVPSRYYRGNNAGGIKEWTTKITTKDEIDQWSKQSDYGICVQTRRVKALDIDVDDYDLAREIFDCFELMIGEVLPLRTRPNSGKCLTIFIVEGGADLGKSKFTLPGGQGLVEILGTGQQFIACGRHKSKVHYEWQGGMPTELVTISLEQFESAWAALVKQYANGDATVSKGGNRRVGEDLEIDDPVAAYLEENWPIVGSTKGMLYIECPWQDHHSMDSGHTQTSWLLAGTNGHQSGMFKCMHAGCAGHSQTEFLKVVGYTDAVCVFSPIEIPPVSETPFDVPKEGAAFVRDKGGAILAIINNIATALRRPDYTGMVVAIDTFKGEMVKAYAPGAWEPFLEEDFVFLQMALEGHGFKPIGRTLLRDTVRAVAKDNEFDSAQIWLDSLVWDGVPRVETFLETYFSVPASAYAAAISRYMWSALAGRIITPGVKADMVPIFVGAQGVGKSTAVMALVPGETFYSEVHLGEKEDDISRKLRGCLAAELSELKGLHTKEMGALKAFVSRQFEKWVPKYQEMITTSPRRCLFFGTTNDQEFLADDTGNRRWLPITVGEVDVAGIKAVREQLWAEGAALYRASGILWSDAQELATGVHRDYTISDSWEDLISDWLDTMAFPETPERLTWGQSPVRMSDVMKLALGLSRYARGDELRAGRVLRGLGYEKRDFRAAGRVLKGWIKPK